jgi:hypothetical protein
MEQTAMWPETLIRSVTRYIAYGTRWEGNIKTIYCNRRVGIDLTFRSAVTTYVADVGKSLVFTGRR